MGCRRSALTGKMEPNVTSLEEMAAFCDEILHKEDEEGYNKTENPKCIFLI